MTTSSIAKAIARIPKSVARGSRSRCRMIRPMEGRRRDGRGAARRGRIVRISGWHINGFGMFADYRLDDLSPGLTVLHGPNEAGKSTLVNYILSILFGFADGRSKGPRYEPLVGGNHGGKLFLEDGEGTYVVERTKAGKIPTVRYPDGGAGGQDAIFVISSVEPTDRCSRTSSRSASRSWRISRRYKATR